MGIGITEATPHQVVLQTSIDPAKLPIDSALPDEAVQAFPEFNHQLTAAAIRQEEEVNRVYCLTIRPLWSAPQNTS
jgi:hypothetical protein